MALLKPMRSVTQRAILFWLSTILFSTATAFEWELVPVKSRDFLKIKDISEFYRLQFSHTKTTFRSTRKGILMEGKIDSKQLTINDVTFDLQYPVKQHEKGLLLSRYDLAILIDPILNPVPRNVQDTIDAVEISLLPPHQEKDTITKANHPPAFLTSLSKDLILVLQSQNLAASEVPATELPQTGPSPTPPTPNQTDLPQAPDHVQRAITPLGPNIPSYFQKFFDYDYLAQLPSTPQLLKIPAASGPVRIYLAWETSKEPGFTTAILIPPGTPKDDAGSKPWDLDHRVFLGNMWDAENLQFATLLTSELHTLKSTKNWSRTIIRETSNHLRTTDCPSIILKIQGPAPLRDNPEAHVALIRETSIAATKAVLRMDALLKRQSLTDRGRTADTKALQFASMESLNPSPEDDTDTEFNFGMRLKIVAKDRMKIDPAKIDLQVYAVDIFNESEVNLTAALPPRFLWESDEPNWRSGRPETVDVLYRYPRIWELTRETDTTKKPPQQKTGTKKPEKPSENLKTKSEDKTSTSDTPADLRDILIHSRVRNYGYVARLVYDGELVDEIAHPRPLEGHLGWFATLWPVKP